MELSNEDIKFITDETLDFGLFSPFDRQEQGSSAEHRERCVPKKIDMNILLGENVGGLREQTSEWSPLSPEKLEEVMKEANFLAEQLESCRLLERDCSETRLETVPEFEPLPPTGVLQVEKLTPRNPRRRTFSVSNSPLKELLPLVGPETCSDQVFSKAPFPEDGSPVSCAAELLSSRKLQQRSNICRTDSQLSKKSRPNQPLKIRTMTANCKKTTSRSSGKDKSSPLALSHAIQAQDSLLHLKTLPQTSQRGLQRKTQEASGKASVEVPRIFPAVAAKEEHKVGRAEWKMYCTTMYKDCANSPEVKLTALFTFQALEK
ncbi:proline/serine-rich coiled-coil protein 1 [Varanus komodoensis]|uniref:proline/serine-rich coiled-coil protein 1 n=1 Tax=Varanus komodoensis TaxID=61221 RepID=UPI001CF78811|nr:proline/serine-rich coiled-coil protein 1 [Varanus komodoensis]